MVRTILWQKVFLKLLNNHNFKTTGKAKLAVFEYIEVWFNRKRLHSCLEYKTHKEMELEFYQIKNVP
ncbi:IS3 family transposase [Thalassobellus citreus]|uniref:IS3 family transposase n=1 Tax=Thalassobellus citreus TaxID=3367752 RepID=UPI0037919E13